MLHVVVGTAGHIDHGKSALVKALTGIDPDRLKEEKERGITIDLGFAHLDLGDIQVGFVDVPGHEKFVKNMLAGVGGIDFVLLVVAADESIMPQTREHFDICRLLGIKAGIVVITKIDLVDSEMLEMVRDEILQMTAGTFLEKAVIITASSRTGEGLSNLREAIARLANEIPRRAATGALRLPVDRAFSIRGFGTVITGTLTSGSIKKDEEVELIPGRIVARVRNIQVYGTTCPVAVAGQRTAINLQGVDLEQVGRGTTVTVPRMFSETGMVDAYLELLPGARPLKNFIKVRFHHTTSEILARVSLLGRQSLQPGNSSFAQLRLDAPIFCLHDDPFIIRQFSPAITIGGGRILHPRPAKHRTFDRQATETLSKLHGGTLPEKILTFVACDPRQYMDLAELKALFGLCDAELKEACSQLTSAGRIVGIQAPTPLLVLPALLNLLTSQTLNNIEKFHEQNALQKGISREELRKRVYDGIPLEIFRHCLELLSSTRKISLQGDMVGVHGREIQLSLEGQEVKDWIEERVLNSGFQPPLLSELSGSQQYNPEIVRKIYFWMLKERILIKVAEELAYHRSTMEEIKTRIRNSLGPGTKFGVAEFKETLGITRKHAIPLLEYLDRERITRRQGNDRILLV